MPVTAVEPVPSRMNELLLCCTEFLDFLMDRPIDAHEQRAEAVSKGSCRAMGRRAA